MTGLPTQSGITNTTTLSGQSMANAYPDGYETGETSSALLGFYGATPIVQRSGSAQAAVATTAATTTTPWGFTTSTQANAVVTLVNEIRATLVALGLMKGSA